MHFDHILVQGLSIADLVISWRGKIFQENFRESFGQLKAPFPQGLVKIQCFWGYICLNFRLTLFFDTHGIFSRTAWGARLQDMRYHLILDSELEWLLYHSSTIWCQKCWKKGGSFGGKAHTFFNSKLCTGVKLWFAYQRGSLFVLRKHGLTEMVLEHYSLVIHLV